MSSVVRALAFSLCLPSLAAAQALGGRITAGGGMEAIMYDGSKYLPAYVGQLGLEWRMGTRGALRLGLMHYQQNRTDSDQFVGGCSAQCVSSMRYGTTGLLFDGTFDLTRGRFRPYLLSGVGLYRTSTTSASNYACSGFMFDQSCSYTGQMQSYRRTGWGAGMHSGIGFTAQFQRATLFTETRVMVIGGSNQESRGMVPIVFGVKF